MASGGNNRQARKTRAALLEAFGDLVRRRRYDAIRVADIVRRADVGRSTFYEHFRDKDDLLRQSLSGILAVMADAAGEGCDRERLRHVLEHFRENGRLARGLVNGPSAPQVVTLLADLIGERLEAMRPRSAPKPVIPLDLAAAQAAEGMLGLVRAWLNGGARCPAAAVAEAMHRTATAAARALWEG